MSGHRRRVVRPQFTLIELLVVVSIIAILAALLLPVLGKAKAKARAVSCMGNERQINLGLNMYAGDFEEYLPGITSNAAGSPLHPSTGPDTYTYSPHTTPGGPGRGLGRLYLDGIMKDWRMFYCPGRNDTVDTYALRYGLDGVDGWHGNYLAKWPVFPASKSGTSGWLTVGYITATCDQMTWNGNTWLNVAQKHRLNVADPEKLMVMEPCFKKTVSYAGAAQTYLGSSRHRHGTGYNFIFFDGSGKWYDDVGNYMELSLLFRQDNNPCTGVSHAHWQNTTASDLLYYIQTRKVGWDHNRFLSQLVRDW